MPVFYILLVIGLIALFFLLSWLYKPLGKFVGRIVNDARDIINEEDVKDNKEEK